MIKKKKKNQGKFNGIDSTSCQTTKAETNVIQNFSSSLQGRRNWKIKTDFKRTEFHYLTASGDHIPEEQRQSVF